MDFKLMEGFKKHHRSYLPKNFKSKNGSEAKNEDDNAAILNKHFHCLFNSQVQVDPTPKAFEYYLQRKRRPPRPQQ